MPYLLTLLPVSPYWQLRIPAVLLILIYAFAKRKAFNMLPREILSATAFVGFGVIAGAKAVYVVGQIIIHGKEPNFWMTDNWIDMLKAGGVLYGSYSGQLE